MKIYELIVILKNSNGADAAINFCQCLTDTQKGNCAKVVRDYIKIFSFDPKIPNYTPNPRKEITKFVDKYNEKGNLKTLEQNKIIINCKKCIDKLKNNKF